MRVGSLFSGIGGLDLGLAVHGYTEVAADCRKLEQHYHGFAQATGRDAAALLAGVAAALPTCPTCGGTQKGAPGISVDGEKSWAHCPDCSDGKVTVAQMAALWEAVWSDEPMIVHPRGPEPWHWVTAVAEYLRSVRPVAPSPEEGT